MVALAKASKVLGQDQESTINANMEVMKRNNEEYNQTNQRRRPQIQILKSEFQFRTKRQEHEKPRNCGTKAADVLDNFLANKL